MPLCIFAHNWKSWCVTLWSKQWTWRELVHNMSMFLKASEADCADSGQQGFFFFFCSGIHWVLISLGVPAPHCIPAFFPEPNKTQWEVIHIIWRCRCSDYWVVWYSTIPSCTHIMQSSHCWAFYIYRLFTSNWGCPGYHPGTSSGPLQPQACL